jgi:hypothetical protein
MNNELPTPRKELLGLSEELGGGTLTLTCRGNFGIAPIYLTLGGAPITGIATVYENGDVLEKRIHNDKPSALKWLKDAGAGPDERAALLEDLEERMARVTE